jgi:FkbM family methyltransferase
MALTKYQQALRVFNALPANLQNWIVRLLRIVNIKKEKYYTDLYYKGVFKTGISNALSFKMISSGGTLENRIFWYGIIDGYEPESLLPWLHFSKHSSTIVDIGANVGIYTLIAKAVNNNADVICFEPSDAIYARLNDNIKLNNFTKVAANKKGISDTTGTLLFYDIDAPDHTSASFSADKIKNVDPATKLIEHQVDVITLDDYISQNNISKVDLIKIDVELFEKQVLDGSLNCLKNHRPIVFFEVLTDEVANNLQPIFTSLNYSLFHLDVEHRRPKVVEVDKLYLNQNNLWNFLAIPSENKEVHKTLTSFLNSL